MTTGERWREAFVSAMRQREVAESLKEAALAERLRDWTTLLTGVVVGSCRTTGWAAAAKGHALDELPQAGQEFLGLDVMAFGACRRWPRGRLRSIYLAVPGGGI